MPKPEGAARPVPDGGPGEPEPVAPEPLEYVVLCGPEDRSALWAAQALRDRGLPVRVVTTQEVVYSTSLRHTVSSDAVTTAVRLADGTLLGPGLRGTLNRMTWVPTEHLAGAAPADREYAQQELHAVLTSVVHGLPGVVLGRADGRGLCGAAWRTPEWMTRAGRAGLLVSGYRSGAPARAPAGGIPVVVVLDEVVAPEGVTVPPEVVAALLRLAHEHGSGLLGVEVEVDQGIRAEDDEWRVMAVTPVPDLTGLGDALVAALHAALLGRARVPA